MSGRDMKSGTRKKRTNVKEIKVNLISGILSTAPRLQTSEIKLCKNRNKLTRKPFGEFFPSFKSAKFRPIPPDSKVDPTPKSSCLRMPRSSVIRNLILDLSPRSCVRFTDYKKKKNILMGYINLLSFSTRPIILC